MACAARSGVLINPSRPGSSPRRPINSAYSSSVVNPPNPRAAGGLRTTAGCAMRSLSRIFKEIVLRLFHAYSFQISVNKVLREEAVNGDTQILCGRHLGTEALIAIQIHVIEAVNHVCFHTAVQVLQVANHSRHRMYWSANGNLDGVVMAMPVRIAAFAIERSILLLAVNLGIEAVRGTEHVSPRQISSHGSP